MSWMWSFCIETALNFNQRRLTWQPSHEPKLNKKFHRINREKRVSIYFSFTTSSHLICTVTLIAIAHLCIAHFALFFSLYSAFKRKRFSFLFSRIVILFGTGSWRNLLPSSVKSWKVGSPPNSKVICDCESSQTTVKTSTNDNVDEKTFLDSHCDNSTVARCRCNNVE